MSDSTATTVERVTFLQLLTLLFVGLKLTHVIDWSWWYVLMPLWLPVALYLVFVVLCVTVIIVATIIHTLIDYFGGK